MTSSNKPIRDEGGRKREYEKLAKKAKQSIGNLDFIDELPEPPKRGEIVFPYGDHGKPRPYGSTGWQ